MGNLSPGLRQQERLSAKNKSWCTVGNHFGLRPLFQGQQEQRLFPRAGRMKISCFSCGESLTEGENRLYVLPSPQQVRLPQHGNFRGQLRVHSPVLYTGLLFLVTVTQLGSQRSSRDLLTHTCQTRYMESTVNYLSSFLQCSVLSNNPHGFVFCFPNVP